MSKRLIQDLHAGISRRDWWAVETAANRLRDEVEQTVAILAGTGAGSLPNDYPLFKLASEAITPAVEPRPAPPVEQESGTGVEPAPSAHLRAIADAAQAYVDAVSGEPEKDCWDTEDGKEAPGAERFASDWSWKEYDDQKQKAFDALRAALATTATEDGR